MCAALVILLLSAFPGPATSARVQLSPPAGPDNDLTPKLLREKWCTDSEAQLTCQDHSVIQVQAAFYSTRTTEECNVDADKQDGPESCDVNATQMVYDACENKAQCTIAPASFAVCQTRPFSIIKIAWECVNGATVVAITEEEADRLVAEEAERLAAKKAEADRLAEEEAALAAKKAEADRLAEEEAALAAAKKEADRLAAEAAAQKEEADRLAAEKAAEAARLAAEEAAKKVEADRLAAEKAEADRLAAKEAAHRAKFTRDFKVRIKTSNKWWSGTNDNVHIQLLGENGPSGWKHIDKWWHDDFERGSSAWYSFRSKNKMYPHKVCFKKDGSDGWRPAEVEIYSGSDQFIGKNTDWGFIDDHNEHCRDI